MKRKLKIVFSISPLIVALDQLTKQLIVNAIPPGGQIVVWEHFLDLVHVQNRGAAFGMLSAWHSSFRDLFFYFISALALLFLFYFLKKTPQEDKTSPFPIALIFGGALGNLSDRLLRGSVVDFVSLHWNNKGVDWQIFGRLVHLDLVWPAFNVADSAITVGVFWLLILMLVHEQRK